MLKGKKLVLCGALLLSLAACDENTSGVLDDKDVPDAGGVILDDYATEPEVHDPEGVERRRPQTEEKMEENELNPPPKEIPGEEGKFYDEPSQEPYDEP